MTDQVDDVPENKEDLVEVPEIEVEAREHGWRPKEEFDADPKNAGKKWRSAEDFMDRKSLFDKIESQGSEIKTLKKGLQSFAQHYTNVEKAAFQRALNELKAERRQALEDGEHVKADEIQEKMDDLKEKIDTVQPPVQVQPEERPEFVEWKQRNKWYKTDSRLTKFADALGKSLHDDGYSPAEILEEVETQVKKAYPEKFRNPNRETAPEMVASGKKAAADPHKGFRLSDEERRIMNNMVRTGIMTEEQYIADLKKMRG